ncbi:MAG: GC-type dockerin domain-anchored protein [Phycisphaerales bacterium]
MNRQNRTAIVALAAGTTLALLSAPTASAQTTIERASQRMDGQTVVQCNGDSRQPQIAADGNTVVFISASNNLVISGPNSSSAQVWKHNRANKGNTFLTLNGFDGPPTNAPRGLAGSCSDPAYRGGPALFTNNSNSNEPFDPCPDANDADDIYNGTSLFSKTGTPNPCGTFGNGDSIHAAVTGDGAFAVFETTAWNLISGDLQAGFRDIAIRYVGNSNVSRISVTGNIITGTTPANGASYNPAVSYDGSTIAFESDATNLGGGGNFRDIFVRWIGVGAQVQLPYTELVSKGMNGQGANSSSATPSLSSDGRYVAFASAASNLVPNDLGGFQDIFVYDRTNDTMELVSVNGAGQQANASCSNPIISDNGRFVAFVSSATNLASGTINGVAQVYMHDRTTGSTWRASVNATGNAGDGASANPSLSADGLDLAFDSTSANLIPSDSNARKDVFIRTWSTVGNGNDICAGAYPAVDGTTIFTNTNAHTDGFSEASCTGAANTTMNFARDLWWRYTATRTGNVSVSTVGLCNWDTMLAVYGSCPSGPGQQIACDDDTPSAFTSSVSFAAVAGQSYLIRVGGYNDSNFGSGGFRINSCPADVAGLGGTLGADGILTVDDIVVYLSQFFANNLAVTDIAQLGGTQGPDGQITVDDLVLFLNLFFSGCN